MRTLLRTLAISALFVVFAPPAHAQVSFGFRIGPPPAPRMYRVPPQPGPEFVWVEGYWYPQGSRYAWHNGYWTRPPFAGAYWVEPYYVGGQYFGGRWEDGRRSIQHDHRWDRRRERDEFYNRGGDRNDRRR